MKVFIGWSGDESKQLAQMLRRLLRKVFPAITVEVSYEENKGAVWLPRLVQKLERTRFGVLCMTPANLNSEWLLFEAGVLSMATTVGTEKRLCPYLLGVEPGYLPSPLGMFQTAYADWDGTRELLDTIVKAQSAANTRRRSLDRKQEQVFESHWPEFKAQLDSLQKKLGPKKIRVKRLELRDLLTSHRESVIFRIQKRVKQAYPSVLKGRYNSRGLLEAVDLEIKESQSFYKGLVGARLGKDVTEFLVRNFNKRHLKPIFKEMERTYLDPVIGPRRERKPTRRELDDTLEELLEAIETATRHEFLKLFSKLQDQEW